MRPFKAGDRVTRVYKRLPTTKAGTVTEIFPYTDYPIKVVWDGGNYELFTEDGYTYQDDKRPGASRIEHAVDDYKDKIMFKVGDRVVADGARKTEGEVISTKLRGEYPLVVMLDNGILLTRDTSGASPSVTPSPYGNIRKVPKIEKVTFWVVLADQGILKRCTEVEAMGLYENYKRLNLPVSKPIQVTFDVEVTES